MSEALTVSVFAALLLASLIRICLPGNILHPLAGPAWEWWLMCRPAWLPAKATGDCIMCSAFWLPGVPVALWAGVATPAGWWALCVPLFVAFLTEHFTARLFR